MWKLRRKKTQAEKWGSWLVPGSLACTWSLRSLLGTCWQDMKDIITTKLKICTRSLSVCSWATQSQDPHTQETCTRRGCSPCRSHRTWSSPGWGNDWQRSCTVYDFFDCSKLAFLQVYTLTGVVILHLFWFYNSGRQGFCSIFILARWSLE